MTMDDRTSDELADIDAGRATMDDLEQQNFTHPAVPVRVADPVQVQTLPTISATSRNVAVAFAESAAVKLLNHDPRRSLAHITCTGDAVFVGTDRTAVEARAAYRLPVAQLLTVRSIEPWYVLADKADALVSVISEQWAE